MGFSLSSFVPSNPFSGGGLPGLDLLGGGGSGGSGVSGIGNDQEITNASQSDDSLTMGNEAFYNSGTFNVTDGGATKAAIEANSSTIEKVLETFGGVFGSAMSGVNNAATIGASAATGTPIGVTESSGVSITKNQGVILAAIAAVIAAIFFFRKK